MQLESYIMNTIQSIIACAFVHQDGKLLIAKRAATKKFLPDKYELLGGHVEFGETLEQCIVREIQEELHIDVIVEDPFYAFTYLSDENTIHNVEVDFFAQMRNPQQRIVLNPDDHSEFKWISREEVSQYFDENDEEKLAVIKGFELLKK